MFDYSAALVPISVTSLGLGFLAFTLGNLYLSTRNTQLVGCTYTFPAAACCVVFSFLFLFPLLNIWHQREFVDLAFLGQEFRLGVLVLRTSSIFLVVTIIRDVVRSSQSVERQLSSLVFTDQFEESEKECIAAWLEAKPLVFIRLSDGLFYGTLMILLWSFQIMGVSGGLITAINWTVFFILDDAAVIAHYRLITMGRLLRSHQRRLVAINTLLFIAAPASIVLYWAGEDRKEAWPAVFWTVMVLVAALFIRSFGPPLKGRSEAPSQARSDPPSLDPGPSPRSDPRML